MTKMVKKLGLSLPRHLVETVSKRYKNRFDMHLSEMVKT